MKTKKMLKLDSLSSSELTGREAAQINGSGPLCGICRCLCPTTRMRLSELSFERVDYNSVWRP